MSYIKKKVYLSEGQIDKLNSALRKNEEITLQIDKSKSPNYDIYLTKTQINQINQGKRITISKTSLKKNGGFLPFIIPILTSLGLGAVSGVGAYGAKKALDKITGSGCKKKKKNGKGFYPAWEYPTS